MPKQGSWIKSTVAEVAGTAVLIRAIITTTPTTRKSSNPLPVCLLEEISKTVVNCTGHTASKLSAAVLHAQHTPKNTGALLSILKIESQGTKFTWQIHNNHIGGTLYFSYFMNVSCISVFALITSVVV